MLLCLVAGVGCRSGGGADSPDVAEQVPRLQELVTIGCPEYEGVGQITPIGVSLSATRVFVTDRYEPVVRVFALEGEEVGAFGMRGQGPGELELGVAALPVSDELVIVYDLMGLMEYTSTGEYLRTMRWSPRLPHSFDFVGTSRQLYMVASPLPMEGGGVEDLGDGSAPALAPRW